MRRLLLIGGACALVACGKSNNAKQADTLAANLPPGHVPVTTPTNGVVPLTPEAQALVDSGNADFRKKDYEGALAFYHKAAEADPNHAAPWFGTYMVGQAMKNTKLADSALAMVRARAPEMQSHPGGMPGTMPGVAPGTIPGPDSATPFSPHRPAKPPQGTTS